MTIASPYPKTGLTKRSQLSRLDAQLKNDRNSWEGDWRDLGDHFSPYAYQANLTDANQGGRRDSQVIDPQGILSTRTAVSGLMAGLTNPTSRWCEIKPRNPDLATSKASLDWCKEATERLEARFARSNLYQMLPLMYEDILVFGTGASTMLEVPTDVLFHFGHQQMGTYSLANDDQGKVNTMARQFRMTAAQMVQAFGLANVSDKVKAAIDNDLGQAWFDVGHILRPNATADRRRMLSQFKAFESCYYEPGTEQKASDMNEKILAEAGFDEFPLIVGRWKVRGSDVYGRGPALDIIGACRALQAYQYKMALAVDKELDPSLIAPAGMDVNNISLLPGSINSMPEGSQGQLQPTHSVQLRLDHALMQIQDLRNQIKRGLFEDLFLMIANAKGQMTAREIIERQEEKVQQLGPVILNLSHEMLDPMISRGLAIMFRRGEMPEVPPELAGQPLKVEYVSGLAQAQQLIDAQAIVETTQFAMSLAPGQPAPPSVINVEASVREFARLRRSAPKIIRSEDEVAAIEEQAQQQAQAQQQQMQAQQAADTAKTLAGADTSGQNALTDTANALQQQGGLQ